MELILPSTKLRRWWIAESFSAYTVQSFVNFDAIEEMYTYSKARVKLNLTPEAPFEAVTSSERSADFKEWLKGK